MSVLFIILGILLVIVGFSCIFTPLLTFLGAGYFILILVGVFGVLAIVNACTSKKYGINFVFGILSVIFAVIMLFFPNTVLVADGLMLYLTAAWFIAAMYEYTVDPKEGEKMISFLCDPDEARSVTGFVTDQLRQKEYLATAYFKGANKDNDFTPDEPLQITLTNFDNRENNKFTYVRVACDSDKRDRTIALIEDDVVGYRVVKCPALLLGIN